MNGQDKRKLKEVVRGLIGDGFHGTQNSLVKELKKRGFDVTQSTVSRLIQQMGIAKETHQGRPVYRLRPAAGMSYRGSLTDLVISIENNKSLIVIRTTPGSAMFVAGFLDHECKDCLLGTIAGDDTIFAAPLQVGKIVATQKKMKELLRS